MKRKHLAIIANPASGSGRALEAVHQARQSLWGWEIDFHYPKSGDELASVCEKLDPALTEAAIVLGGDGTLHFAIRGLRKSGVPLAAYPVGTANDLATELNLTRDWNTIQQLIDCGVKKPMDLIEVNGIPFATIAGIGVGSILTDFFNKKRYESLFFSFLAKKLHSQIYTWLTLQTILLRRDFVHRIRVKSDIFDEKLKTGALLVCNQRRLGGSMTVARASNNSDARFNVLIVPQELNLQLIQSLIQLKRGNLSHGFVSFSTDHLTIESLNGKPIAVFADGEPILSHPHLEFSIKPDALTVYRERRRKKRKISEKRKHKHGGEK